MAYDSDEQRKLFPREIRTRISQLHRQLSLVEKGSPSGIIDNDQLKRDLASACLDVFDLAERLNLPVEAVLSLLGGFAFYEFDDSLDKAFGLLHELDFDCKNLREGTFDKQVARIHQILTDYPMRELP